MYTHTYSKMSLPSFISVHGLCNKIQALLPDTPSISGYTPFPPVCLFFWPCHGSSHTWLHAVPQSMAIPQSTAIRPFSILYPILGKPVCMSITWLSWCPMPAGSRSLWQAMPARPPARHPACLTLHVCRSLDQGSSKTKEVSFILPSYRHHPPLTLTHGRNSINTI